MNRFEKRLYALVEAGRQVVYEGRLFYKGVYEYGWRAEENKPALYGESVDGRNRRKIFCEYDLEVIVKTLRSEVYPAGVKDSPSSCHTDYPLLEECAKVAQGLYVSSHQWRYTDMETKRITFAQYALAKRCAERGISSISIAQRYLLAERFSGVPLPAAAGMISFKGNRVLECAREVFSNSSTTYFLKDNIKKNQMTLSVVDDVMHRHAIEGKDGEEKQVAYMTETSNHIICDLDSGKVYYLNKGMNKKDRKFVNDTYGMSAASAIRCKYYTELLKMLVEYRRKQGYYAKEHYNIGHIVRFPNLSEYAWNQMKSCSMRTKLPIGATDSDAMKLLGITKALYRYSWNLSYELLKLGFDQNSIIKIQSVLKKEKETYGEEFIEEEMRSALNIYQVSEIAYAVKTLRKRGYSVKKITNMIQKYDPLDGNLEIMLSDIGSMCRAINKARIKYDLSNQNGLRRIHDSLAQLQSRIEKKNVAFNYNEWQREFEDVIDGYRFILPLCVHDVVSIGDIMHHCVGGYTDKILQGQCTIVAVLNPKKALVNCIEVKGGEVSQSKCRYDHKPTGELKEIVKRWAMRKRLDITKCHDLIGADYEFLAEKREVQEEEEDYTIENGRFIVNNQLLNFNMEPEEVLNMPGMVENNAQAIVNNYLDLLDVLAF